MVKRFYDQNYVQQLITPNTIRQKHSENGGVDIYKLYTNHLYISILNDNHHGHYFSNYDQYKLLDEYNPNMHINIDDDTIELDEHIENNNNHIDPAYLSQDNIDIIINNNYNYIPRPLDRSQPDADISSDNTNLVSELNKIPAPKSYVQPTPKVHDPELGPDGKPLRRSPRLKAKRQEEEQQQDGRYEQLHIDGLVPFTIKQLKLPGRHQYREKHRQSIKAQNQSVIDNKPYEYVWNKDILLNTRYHIPIKNDYSEIFNEANHIKTNFLRIKQFDDPICFAIIQLLDKGNRALIEDLPEYIQRYVLSGRFILDREGVLCFKHTRTKIPLRVAPAILLSTILQHAHGKLHQGKTKMEHIIVNKMEYWWPKMREHIKLYVKCCNTCQHIKPGVYKAYSRGKMKLFPATEPFEQISVDIVGPLPTSYSGNRYIVTMIDSFSRYCMLVPVPDITSLSVVKAIDRWITTFGPPKSMLSDNGPQFISHIYRDFLSNHKKIKYKYTSTYHPQCNGQVERLHRWIKQRLSLISYDGGLNFVEGKDDWADYCGIIQYTYNSTPNRMTSYAPLDIMLGVDDYKLKEYEFTPRSPDDYIDYLAYRQMIVKNSAQIKQAIYDKVRKKRHDEKIDEDKIKKYEIGQKVLWNVNSQFTGNAQKLGPKWIGPFEITKIFNDELNYKLRVIPLPPLPNDCPMNKLKVPRRAKTLSRNVHEIDEFNVHRSQIKPYYESYESQFDGTQSPIQLCIHSINQSLYNNTTNDNNKIIRQYQSLFHMEQQKLNIGYFNKPSYL